MPIGKALLLKGLGGLAALGGAIGGGCYIYNRHYSNLETRFDRGLIDYLDAGGKIQFSVKENNGTTDISTTFPSFTANSDSQTKTATVTIKVSVGTATSGNEGTLTDATSPAPEKGQKSYLQKLNKSSNGDTGTAWTWICEVKFTKTADDTTATELKDKEKLVKDNGEKGFFNKLKDADTTNKYKDLKKEFIKNCAAAREKEKNKKIDELTSLTVTDGVITTANEIKSTKEFKLRKGVTASGEEEGKLYPVDKSDFNYWFGITSN